jgi:hypothetical protein
VAFTASLAWTTPHKIDTDIRIFSYPRAVGSGSGGGCWGVCTIGRGIGGSGDWIAHDLKRIRVQKISGMGKCGGKTGRSDQSGFLYLGT